MLRLDLKHRYPELGTMMIDHETYYGFLIHWQTGWVFHAYFKQPSRPSNRTETFTVVFQPDQPGEGLYPRRRMGQAVLRRFYSRYRLEGIGELSS